jgi:excisionase family DNA binding protein
MLGHDIKAMLPDGRRALRINEFCTAYGVSRSTVYKLATENKLRLFKIGGRSLIRVEDAEALLNGDPLKSSEASAA